MDGGTWNGAAVGGAMCRPLCVRVGRRVGPTRIRRFTPVMDDDLGRDLAAFLDEHRACGTLATGFNASIISLTD